jgi:hypothetical protein
MISRRENRGELNTPRDTTWINKDINEEEEWDE